jgi:hypothetical protein
MKDKVNILLAPWRTRHILAHKQKIYIYRAKFIRVTA